MITLEVFHEESRRLVSFESIVYFNEKFRICLDLCLLPSFILSLFYLLVSYGAAYMFHTILPI